MPLSILPLTGKSENRGASRDFMLAPALKYSVGPSAVFGLKPRMGAAVSELDATGLIAGPPKTSSLLVRSENCFAGGRFIVLKLG